MARANKRKSSPGQLSLWDAPLIASAPWPRPTPLRQPTPPPAPKRRTTGLLYQETCPRKRRQEEQMVAEHIPLLKLIIKQQRHKYHCLEMDDLYSLGLIGLLKAVRRFDPAKGFKFSSIALPFILGEWRHYIRDHNFWLKAPGSVRQRGMQARRLLERGDSPQQVCTMLGIDLDTLKLDLRATTGMGHELGHFELHDSEQGMDAGWL
ncbi:MAG: sigma-70 family RNA polymerase sigma factor [Vulcanococcus sp.]